MRRHVSRVAAATGEIALGLPAVLLFALATAYLFGDSDVDNNRGIVTGVGLVLGGALFAIWMAARTRRRLLITLIIVSTVLFAATTMITILLVRPSRFDTLHGLWFAPATAAVDVLLWLLIAIVAVIELRATHDDAPTLPGWAYLGSIVAPLALVVALSIMVGLLMPSWLIRLNSTVTDAADPQPGQGSDPTGSISWTREIDSGVAVATPYGIAVPMDADGAHSAGVIMIDARTGKQLWRHELRGTLGAPDLETTDDGHGIVINLDNEANLPDDVPGRTYIINAATGRLATVWPQNGGTVDTDPPVIFHRNAQGTNSVVAITPSGHKLWTYRPDRCADPRSVTSTPTTMLVRQRRCGADYRTLDLVGLDAKTGDKLWTRPVDDGFGESGPDRTIARDRFQIELRSSGAGSRQKTSELARRDLTNGSISWQKPAGKRCADNALVDSGRTVFLTTCQNLQREDTETVPPNTVVGYDMQTGKQVVQHQTAGAITAIGGVDDRTSLAVVDHGKTCRLDRIAATTSTLLTLPNEKSSDRDQVAVCRDAALLHVGANWVLQIHIRTDSATLDNHYRFIGLN